MLFRSNSTNPPKITLYEVKITLSDKDGIHQMLVYGLNLLMSENVKKKLIKILKNRVSLIEEDINRDNIRLGIIDLQPVVEKLQFMRGMKYISDIPFLYYGIFKQSCVILNSNTQDFNNINVEELKLKEVTQSDLIGDLSEK